MTVEKDWTRDMRDRLSRHQVTAPDGLLEDVRQEMKRRGLKPGQDRVERAHLVPMTWRRAAAAVAVIVAVGAGLYMTRPLQEDMERVAGRNGGAVNMPTGGSAPSMDRQDTVDRSFVAMDMPVSPPAALEGERYRMRTDGSQTVIRDADAAMVTADTLMSEMIGRQKADASADRRKFHRSSESHADHSRPFSAYVHKKGRHTPIAVSAYLSSVGTAFSGPNGNAVSMLTSDVKCNDPIADVMNNTNYAILMSASQEVHARHRQPIKAGVSLRFPLTDRWSVTAGIDYSYLSSDIEVVSISEVADCDQQLHYVGVPVMVNYSLWHSRRFNIYLSAGGEMQYLVHGSAKWLGNDGSTVSSEASKSAVSLSDHRPQWSVGATAGAEINIVKGFSFYAEPGLNYYFDNGSSVRNIYKDKPLNFSLSLGMRWTVGD